VLDVVRLPADVVGCYGRPAALDRFTESASLSLRVAPDELLRLGERGRLGELETALAGLDAGSLVLDLSSAYALYALRGEERGEAFGRLSQLRLPEPPATLQGLVAQVPAKIVVSPHELLLLVSSTLSHHLPERVRRACADLISAETPLRPGTAEALV